MRIAATLGALVLALWGFSRFVAWVEDRPGAVLDDPVLAWVEPRDLSVPTFACIYAGIATSILLLWRRRARLLLTLDAYVVLLAFRAALMYVTPLDPPPTIVPLRDPLVEHLGAGRTLTRDLFFSGHVATGVLVFLTCPSRWGRAFLLAAAVAVGVMTVVQHAHYAVDVLAAPFLAYCAYRLALRLPWNRGAMERVPVHQETDA
jgi:hypothetical protein